ncbi:MAG: type II secretion system protein GspK [Gammaproteobacteria bacterium]|nr:type II secretion system protein GspK [Gammaproteobacteria bacterium]
MTPQQQNQRQNGVALITAMLVVAMATLIAANLVWDQHLQMRRTESMLAQEQARQYALAAESIGIEILLDDRGDLTDTDSFSDAWAASLGPLELDQGILNGRIEDLQGRFNINNIYRNGQVDPMAQAQ